MCGSGRCLKVLLRGRMPAGRRAEGVHPPRGLPLPGARIGGPAGRIVKKTLYLPSTLALYYGFREFDLATRSPVWMSSVTRSN
jgi:hypothetical protein